MCTFNLLAVTGFIDYLKKVLEWRELYDDVIPDSERDPNIRKIRFDTPHLKEPLQYDMNILPKDEFLPYFDATLQFIKDNMDENDTTKFNELEYERFRRVRDYFATTTYDDHKIHQGRVDFYRWFKEYDKRRNTNFLETFPDLADFYNDCKMLSDAEYKNIIARSSG